MLNVISFFSEKKLLANCNILFNNSNYAVHSLLQMQPQLNVKILLLSVRSNNYKGKSHLSQLCVAVINFVLEIKSIFCTMYIIEMIIIRII